MYCHAPTRLTRPAWLRRRKLLRRLSEQPRQQQRQQRQRRRHGSKLKKMQRWVGMYVACTHTEGTCAQTPLCHKLCVAHAAGLAGAPANLEYVNEK